MNTIWHELNDSREVLYQWPALLGRTIEVWPKQETSVPLYVYRCPRCGREHERVGYPAPTVICCNEVVPLVEPARIAKVRTVRGIGKGRA